VGVVELTRGPFLLLCILSLFGAAAWTVFMSLFKILFRNWRPIGCVARSCDLMASPISEHREVSSGVRCDEVGSIDRIGIRKNPKCKGLCHNCATKPIFAAKTGLH
jgi:hypothetical protein